MITVVFLSNPKHFGYDIITDKKGLYFVHKEEAFDFYFIKKTPPVLTQCINLFWIMIKTKYFFLTKLKEGIPPFQLKTM